MKYLPTSRRLFLCGGSAALALPLLPSLLPRDARAGVSSTPVRYIQVLNPYGPGIPVFFGDHASDQNPQPDVGVKALADIGGDISSIVAGELSAFRDRMSLLLGLDVLIENPNHHYLFPTCASGYAAGVDNDEAPPLSGQDSVDTVMAKSAKVYGDDVPATRRVVNMNPVTTDDYSGNRSFSWGASGGGVSMLRPVKQTQGVLDPFSAGFMASEDEGPDPRERALMEAVYGDYQRVRDGTRISAADRQRLEAYMALVEDLVDGGPLANCDSPTLGDEPDIEAVIDNQFRIVTAAMACGLTRIASVTLGMSQGYGSRHDQHHGSFGVTDSPIIDDFRLHGRRVARLMSMLDAIAEVDGTVLDNAIVYWCMQYGCVEIDGQHNSTNMPALVAGGGGGRLNQGNRIDYRKQGGGAGLPINNLMVTFLNCMGLSSSDYEQDAGQGYGYYGADFGDRPDPAFWNSTEGRRTPLPVLYQGPMMG